MVWRMRVRDLGTELIVDDRPTLDRWIGMFNFAAAGSCAVLAATEYQPGGELRDVVLLLIVPLAAAISGIGLWRALARPTLSLHVDGAHGAVTLTRKSALRRVTQHWPASQVRGFGRAQTAGQDGLPVYRLRLELADGGSLPAAGLWQADGAAVDAVASRANALLGK
jgi:hypothetical protein